MPHRSKNINILHTIFKTVPLLLFLVATFPVRAQSEEELPAFDQKTFEKQLGPLSNRKKVKRIDSVAMLYAARNPEEGLRLYDFAIRYTTQHEIGRERLGDYYLKRGQQYRKLRKDALALNDYLKAQDIFVKENHTVGLQQVYISYAALYMQNHQNAKAIKFALRAKDISEKLRDNESLGVVMNTLATMYKEQHMPDSSLYYYRRSLDLLRQKKNRDQEALVLDNISMLWGSEQQYDSAVYYNQKALELARQEANVYLELQLLLNTTALADNQHDYDKQMYYARRAMHIADSLGNSVYQVYTSLNYASALLNIKQAKEAIKVFRQTMGPMKAMGDLDVVQLAYLELSRAFEMTGTYDSALVYFKWHKEAMDSLDKIRSREKVVEAFAEKQLEAQEQKIDYLNQLNQASEEKNAALAEKNNLKTAVIWISVVLLTVIAVLLFITIRRFRENIKLNDLLQHKNTEITDSINYAQRIQFALLPGQREISELLDAFVVFMPKDIVSGDFYWVAQKEGLVFVAVGDCTGHGVPGGFMSMLGHSFLNDVILDKHVHDPGKILDKLRDKVIAALKQTGATGENKYGMDIGLAVIDKTNNSITYSAANNPLYFYSGNTLHELAADKQPIGFYGQAMKPFTTQKMSYAKGDRLYLFTDGYADQFGGPKGKKLLYKRMKSWVEETMPLEPNQQGNELAQRFKTWAGTHEQVDDVCMIGIRL